MVRPLRIDSCSLLKPRTPSLPIFKLTPTALFNRYCRSHAINLQHVTNTLSARLNVRSSCNTETGRQRQRARQTDRQRHKERSKCN